MRKSVLCVVGVALQLPWLALWVIIRSDHPTSQGPGLMGFVMPIIVCGTLWVVGGASNAVLLVIEVVKRLQGKGRPSALMTALGVVTTIWVVLTAVFLSAN